MSAAPSVSYSITVRLDVPEGGQTVSQLTTAVASAGGSVTALDVTAPGHERLRIDVTMAARDTDHAEQLVEAMRAVPWVVVGKVSDRMFLMHLGGKIEMASKHPIRNRDDLSMIYTPGVARVCLAIANNRDDARRLTIKRNNIAVVTDGSAVLGLGNIGPEAALPVMEGKAALFKRFAGIDAWPLYLDTQDVEEIIAVVRAVAPGFAGINLEDISAPRCFEVEARLREQLDIPVFDDDQHGTAIVVLAALFNALRVVDKKLEQVRIVMSGAGAAGTAIIKLLLAARPQHIVVADIAGVVHRGRAATSRDPHATSSSSQAWIAEFFARVDRDHITTPSPNAHDGRWDVAGMRKRRRPSPCRTYATGRLGRATALRCLCRTSPLDHRHLTNFKNTAHKNNLSGLAPFPPVVQTENHAEPTATERTSA